jgi:tripartite ATP-independent transporter DctP family solute receptor
LIGLKKFILGGIAAAALVAANTTPAPAADITLRCAHDHNKEGFYEIIWQTFKSLVEPLSSGRIEVKIFGGAQLGDEAQLLENMKIGTVDCAGSSVGNIGGHIPKAGLLGVPYIIQNDKHRMRVVDGKGKFFKALSDVVKETGNFRALGMTTAGVRSVYNSKRPIITPDDLKGMKIRVMTSDTQVKSWKALGAVPTAMAFSEVYTGLMTGAVDAAENSPMFLWTMKHFEGVKYYSITAHMVATGVTMISEKAYQKLPEDLRAIVMAAGDTATAVGRFYDEQSNKVFMRKVIAAGIKVNEVDTAPFVAKTASLHDQFAKSLHAEGLLKVLRAEAMAAK